LLEGLVNTDATQLRTDEMLRQMRTRPYLRGERMRGDANQGSDAAQAAVEEQPASLTERAAQVGIAIVDIRLRRFNHPAQVRDEIFAKIQADRKREAENYRLQGEEVAAQIKAEGELAARRIRAEAEAEKTRLEGKARAESTRILNDAAKEAPEFYRIVRLLDGYKQMFGDDKTQLILSLDHPLLALFKDLPKLNSAASKTAGGVTPAGSTNGNK
jgi:membrane protease subunit HflC